MFCVADPLRSRGALATAAARGAANRRAIVKGAGYEYAHVAIDDRSRVAYVEILPDQRGGTSAGFMRRMVGWFARRGVIVSRVLTDNAPGYRSHVLRRPLTRCTCVHFERTGGRGNSRTRAARTLDGAAMG